MVAVAITAIANGIDMLEINGLKVVRGSFKVTLPSLVINDGECVALCGVSGSGKSTLLEAIGLLKPSFSVEQMIIDGIEVDELNKRQEQALRVSHIGIMPQVGGLMPYLSIRDNMQLQVALALKQQVRAADSADGDGDGKGATAAKATHDIVIENKSTSARVNEYMQKLLPLCERMQLEACLDKLPEELSIGQRQRALFLRALAHKPRLLLIDEPTASLDPDNAASLFEIIDEIAHQEKISVLLVTHDIKAAMRYKRYIYDRAHSYSEHSIFVLDESYRVTGSKVINDEAHADAHTKIYLTENDLAAVDHPAASSILSAAPQDGRPNPLAQRQVQQMQQMQQQQQVQQMQQMQQQQQVQQMQQMQQQQQVQQMQQAVPRSQPQPQPAHMAQPAPVQPHAVMPHTQQQVHAQPQVMQQRPQPQAMAQAQRMQPQSQIQHGVPPHLMQQVQPRSVQPQQVHVQAQAQAQVQAQAQAQRLAPQYQQQPQPQLRPMPQQQMQQPRVAPQPHQGPRVQPQPQLAQAHVQGMASLGQQPKPNHGGQRK